MWKLEIYFYVIIFQFFLYLNLGGKGILEQKKKVPRFHGYDKTVNPARMFFFSHNFPATARAYGWSHNSLTLDLAQCHTTLNLKQTKQLSLRTDMLLQTHI